METSIIIESNQQLAKKNHLIDYGTAILDDNNNQTFSNAIVNKLLRRRIR